MTFNFSELQQKMDRLLYNIAEQNRKAYQLFYDPTPRDVQLPQLDENGNLITVTIPNRAKIKAEVASFISGARSEFGAVNIIPDPYLKYQGTDSNGNPTGKGKFWNSFYYHGTNPSWKFINLPDNVWSSPTYDSGTDEDIAWKLISRAIGTNTNWGGAVPNVQKVTLPVNSERIDFGFGHDNFLFITAGKVSAGIVFAVNGNCDISWGDAGLSKIGKDALYRYNESTRKWEKISTGDDVTNSGLNYYVLFRRGYSLHTNRLHCIAFKNFTTETAIFTTGLFMCKGWIEDFQFPYPIFYLIEYK